MRKYNFKDFNMHSKKTVRSEHLHDSIFYHTQLANGVRNYEPITQGLSMRMPSLHTHKKCSMRNKTYLSYIFGVSNIISAVQQCVRYEFFSRLFNLLFISQNNIHISYEEYSYLICKFPIT